MTGLVKAGFSLIRNAIISTSVRSIATTNPLNLKDSKCKTSQFYNLISEPICKVFVCF